jgi:pimeloyl-ACP methyl ester carboxylesterase
MCNLRILLLLMIAGLTACNQAGSNAQTSRGDTRIDANPAMSPNSKYTTVNGIRIHYLEWGSSGPVIILLHGMNDDAMIWKDLAPILASGYRIIAPDRRGTGSSDKPEKGNDFKTLVNDIALMAESLNLKPFILIGHSFGAEIALAMAAEKPGLIRSVVLVDGGFWPKRADDSTTASSEIEKTSRDYDPEVVYPKVTLPVLLVIAHGTGPGADVLDELKKQGIDYLEEIKKTEQRVRDLVDRKLHNGQITFIENTRHWVQVDQPKSLAQAIKQFLVDQDKMMK